MSSRTTIHNLPNEIITEVVSHLPVYHQNRVVDSSHVASFSSTSRRMRAVSVSHLFREVTITSVHQLLCFSEGLQSRSQRRLLRELNLFMDEAFLDAWITASRLESTTQSSSPFLSIAHLLSYAPKLRALRIRVAEPCGGRTAWKKFGLAKAGGVDFDAGFRAAWSSSAPLSSLSSLRILEIDGFQNVDTLLRAAPHLTTLRLAISAGFSRAVNDRLVDALRYIPELRHLSYTPDTLRLSDHGDKRGSSVDVLFAIANALPRLETLDLQTRYHRHSIYLCSSSEPLVQNELVAALSSMPQLQSITLPSSTMSTKDFLMLRTPLPVSTPEHALEDLPSLREALSSRTTSLLRAAGTEKETVERVGCASSNLRSVTFSRNVEADDPMEYSIRYDVCQRGPLPREPPRVALRSSLYVSVHSTILTAAEAEHCTPLLPQPPPMSLALTLQKLWSAPPANRRIRTLASAWAIIPAYPAEVFQLAKFSPFGTGKAEATS